MNPQPNAPFKSVFAARRRVWCAHYNGCIDLAIKEGWESWSCADCHDFKPQRMSSEELRIDAEHCRVLIYNLFGERATGTYLRMLLKDLAAEWEPTTIH